MTSYIAKAQERWAGAPPDWVQALAREADASPSQTELGRRLNIVASTISAIIGNTYPGKTDSIEARVRGALMRARVDCPVMGSIGRNSCMDYQQQPFSAASPARAQLFRACRKPCRYYMGGK